MNKDAYYFPHFSNARHDRRLKRARKELGVEAYGIFFMILEVLRDQEDFSFPLSDLDLLADEFGTSEQKVEVIVKKYGLFQVDSDGNFFSAKFIEYLSPYLERSKRARNAALKRWGQISDANADANAKQMQSAGNASKVKESKENKSKEKKKIVEGSNYSHPPTEKNVLEYGSIIGADPDWSKTYYLYRARDGFTIHDKNTDTYRNIKDWQKDMAYIYQRGYLKSETTDANPFKGGV
jgi:hypothetical protein